MAMMSIKDAALLWGITERRVNELCKTGRIPGAYKENRHWYIPADTEKPADQRRNEVRYQVPKKASMRVKHPPMVYEGRKYPLPIGVSDYRKASRQYYYVDKTLLIRDLLDECPQVSLFTRPRRFGKTLNMDMLRTFFEIADEDTSIYFRDKKIWKCGKAYQEHQGRYPVIFVTFKDVKCGNWVNTCDMLFKILRNEYERHLELLESEYLSVYDRDYYRRFLEGDINDNDLQMAFLNLSRMLDEHYGIAPIIIIDEYDTPIQEGYLKGFYDDVILFMRNLFSGAFKDNRHLTYGFLTGILKVAKESIFSGLNNLKINSVLEQSYSSYFGFTMEEVQAMADYYGVSGKLEEIRTWYDGYRFGHTEIYNPWSVIGYFNNHCMPRAFWEATGSNDIIKEVLERATPEILERLSLLLQGQTFVTRVDTSVIYPHISDHPSYIYSFLLVAGYLKAVRCETLYSGEYMCEVAIPNQEISFVYKKEILDYMESQCSMSTSAAIQEAMFSQNIPALQKGIERYLMQTVSYYDTASESFYHGLLLGLCAILDNRYRVTSNRESGHGRFDIQMIPCVQNLPGILMELKVMKGGTEEQLQMLCKEALRQMEEKRYDAELEQNRVSQVMKFGVAFSGKRVCISSV